MSDCLFCKIIAQEIPADIIYEDDFTLAFRDIEPQAPTHVLVVPKAHIENVESITAADAEIITNIVTSAQTVAMLEDVAPNGEKGGYRLVMNVGKDAQNSVPHLHMHVIGGRQMNWPPG